MAGATIKSLIQKYALFASFIFSYYGVLSLSAALKIGNGSLVISNSVISIVLFVVFTFVNYKAIKVMSSRSLTYSFIIGCLLSACLILGTQIYLGDNIQISVSTVIYIIGLSLIFVPLFIIFLSNLESIENLIQSKDISIKKSLFNGNWKYFLSVWAIIFVAWIPTFLTVFPGIFFFDSVIQLAQCVNGFHLNSSHPILHTLYLFGTFSLGKNIFGNYAAGMAIYSISQMLMLSASYAYLCYYLAKYKLPIIFQIATILYFILLPIHSMFAVTSTKDVLFSAVLILLVLFTLDLVINSDKFFSHKIYQMRFVITALTMFLLRNNGVYLFVLCVPILIIVFRKHWLKMTFLCILTLFLYEMYTGPVFKVMNVQKGDMREALSAPIQQISRAMRDNPNEISDKEKTIVYQIIPKEGISQYNSRISDPVKSYFRSDVFKKNPIKYIKVWLSIGIKCPVTYTNAFLATNFGFWYPDMIYPDPISHHVYMQNSMTNLPGNYIHIERHSFIPGFQKFYQEVIDNTSFQKIPVLSMLFNEGFSFWMLILTGIVCCYRKKYILFLPFLLYLGLWCTLLLSPVVLLRYAYPIMIAEPLMLAIILFSNKFSVKQLEN